MPTAGMEESIKVAVRARPVNQREKKLECDICVSMSGKTVTMLSERNPKHFTYDYTYWSVNAGEGSQNEIFEDIGNTMLSNAIDGFNCTLFAYGQTGSGKSYTMMGGQDEDDAGVIPRMIEGLFEEKDRLEKEPLQELEVRISYLEIYKEQVTDLFAALNSRHAKGESHKIMEHPKLGVYVKGLYLMPCETKKDVMGNLEYGLKMRTIASTNMNQNSSRSHAVFTIIVNRLEGERPTGKNKDERKSLQAKINLIDLAGSERTSKAQTEQERLKEGCAINQSLSQLGLVIKMLTEQASSGGLKAPMFRASKLTFLLKDSLAGNSKTCMMATISPASDNYDESISTLRFASSVKSIKTVAVQNKNKKDALIENLQEEMRLLKAQMAAGGLNAPEAAEQLKERERLIKEQMQQDFQTELQAAKEMTRAREKALEESGLSHGHITEAFGITSGQPYMVNMAFDPMMAGCLIYLIQESKPTTMGSHKDNTIVLKGLGIPDHLCRLDKMDQEAATDALARQRAPSEGAGPVSLTRLSDGARVAVNGKLLEPGQTRLLQNGDQIFLGRIYVLKLVCPGEGAAPMQDDLVLQKEEMDTSELNNSASWKSLQDYVGQVVRQMSSKSAASQLLDEIKLACRLTDEANEITAECRKEGLSFEVDLTSTYPPCVAIRVLECEKGRDCKDEEEWKNRYIWSVRQLNERLDRMKDYWRECQNYGKPVELPLLEDPWHEAEPTEIFERMRHLESMVEEAERAFKLSHGSQLLITRSMATEAALLRLSFGLWRSCMIAGKRERRTSHGRAALVKAGSGRMRTTIVPDRPFGASKKLLKPTDKPPTTSGRRMTLKLAGPEKSPEKAEPQQSRGSIFDKSPASSPSRLEPEATPEIARKGKQVEAAMAELQRQLDESNQQKAALEHQKAAMEHDLEVAWELVSELRHCLVDKMQQEDQAMATGQKKQEEVEKPQRRQSSSQSLLAHADALAYATRAAVDAAKAVRTAKFQSGIAALPWSSPQLAVKEKEQRIEVIGYTAEPISRSVSPATRGAPSLYRMPAPQAPQAPPAPNLPGMVTPLQQMNSSRSWGEAAAQPSIQQFSQSCNAVLGQTQLRPTNLPTVALPVTNSAPSPSPRGRQAHRLDATTPSPSPRRAPSAPVQCQPQTARRFQAFQAPQPTNANWLYSQPGMCMQPARTMPKRRPSSGTLSQNTADNKAGSESTWESASHLGGAQCLQVAPDMFLVRVPSQPGASPTLDQDLLSTTLLNPVQS